MFHKLQSVVFSELIEHNSEVITKFSPVGDAFASAFQAQLLVWKMETKETSHVFINDDVIESMEWSPDSELIYCCMCKGFVIQIWNLLIPNWKWKVIESPLANIDVFWTPDSRHLLAVSEFHMNIKVWSLVSKTTTEIENVKPVKDCVSFSGCEQYLAVAERTAFEDQVCIITCETWEILKLFPVETKDLSGIYFSPCDLVIAVLESYTVEFKVLFYSIDGRLLSKYEKSSVFGISSLSWHQSGKFIALGNCSGEVSIVQGTYYQEIASFNYPETIESNNTVVYKIIETSSESSEQASTDEPFNYQLYKVEKERPVIVPSLEIPTEKSKITNINLGVEILQCSADGRYIASICGNQQYVLFIYDARELKLSSVIIHQHKITSVSWHPKNPILNICTGTSTMDMWTPTCCIHIFSPFKDDFAIDVAKWSTNQDSLVLNGKDKSSILSLP